MTRRRERRGRSIRKHQRAIVVKYTSSSPRQAGSHHPLISPHHYAVPERHIGPRDGNTPSERVKCCAMRRAMESSRPLVARRTHASHLAHPTPRSARSPPRRGRRPRRPSRPRVPSPRPRRPRGVLRWIHLRRHLRLALLPFPSTPSHVDRPRRSGPHPHPRSLRLGSTPRRRPGAPPRVDVMERPPARGQRQHRRPLPPRPHRRHGGRHVHLRPSLCMFCQATGFRGTTRRGVEEKLAHASALPASVRDASRTAR